MFTSRSNYIFVKLWTEQMEVSQLWNNQYQQWNRSDMDVCPSIKCIRCS